MVGSNETEETLRGLCVAATGSNAEYRRRESWRALRAVRNIELDACGGTVNERLRARPAAA